MTFPEVRDILEKYWKGDSTLEEESQLKGFFQTHSRDSLPLDLQKIAELFSFYDEESKRTTREIPLPHLLEDKASNQTKLSVRSWMKYAAAFILLLAGVSMYFYTNQQPQINKQASEINQKEQKQAFKTTKKALKLVASNLDEGKAEMQKLAVFAEAQNEITGN